MDSLQRYAEIAARDVIDAFQYYMEHFNNGRPFFLMGHSQGSQMLIELLKHGMTSAQRLTAISTSPTHGFSAAMYWKTCGAG